MHVKLLLMVVVGVVSGATSVRAWTWEDLSPAAQRLVPKEQSVLLHLKNGQVREGVITAERDEEIDFSQEQAGMTFELTFQREAIERIEEKDLCLEFRMALDQLAYDEKRRYTELQCRGVMSLIDEFVEKCPDGREMDALLAYRKMYEEELEQLRLGMEKIAGEWLPPVAASVKMFDLYSDRIQQLIQRFPGVEDEDYRENAQAAQQYAHARDERRKVARNLPELVNRRIPTLLESQRFEEAGSELTAFARFWVTRVIRAEAGGQPKSGRADVLQEVFRGMDFGFINRLQQRVLDAYMAAREADPRAGEEDEDGMVYIPGGFFLMGDPEADLRADNFPLRLIHLDAYWLDRDEVTNKEYREFVEYVKTTGDYSMAHPDAPPLKDHTPKGWSMPGLSGDDQPVVGVDWFDAYAYAQWSGKRLPTEAEWERAARGENQGLYPWGTNGLNGKVVNWATGRRQLEAKITKDLAPPPKPAKTSLFSRNDPPPAPPPVKLADATWDVTALRPPGDRRVLLSDITDAVGPWGLYHMAGNAAEWVQDVYDPEGYGKMPMKNPVSESGPTSDRVFRGGSFSSVEAKELAAFYRDSPGHPSRSRQQVADMLVGFRCARDVE